MKTNFIIPLHIGSGRIRIVAALINSQEYPERGNETVTLLNTTDADIDLAGWFVADRTGYQSLGGVLPSGETVRLGGGVQLSNERDTITVLSSEDQIIDQVSYELRNLPGEGYTMPF